MTQYRAIGVAILALGLFLSGWQVRSWYDGAQDAARLEAERAANARIAELVNQVAARTETAIQGIKIENRTIYNAVQKEIIREPIYRECILPADGLRWANQARGGSSATKLDGPLP
jgi:hypothetical protein